MGEDWMHIFVYMLRCADGSYYVGSTRAGLEQRISQHNLGHLAAIRRSADR
jgi:putative endonuclease